jgi:hypothetical protein
VIIDRTIIRIKRGTIIKKGNYICCEGRKERKKKKERKKEEKRNIKKDTIGIKKEPCIKEIVLPLTMSICCVAIIP